ncbi:uncharacterized protein [Spinacia oleracea]|uniref:Uncharacterized protein isoform X4 n=1 Tax=Spinacia oleracea TaxID=3562 RepID=A0ABM3QLX2_SPIOL|nr:uncharacterized protein LOC110799082 isoform X5 [Spinacia oleracea]XP_056684367.1 uncharacterized protein LOC130459092 isoform X4 [Spinacia oleracea]XP_056693516.1 uncharacterized protein LOC130459061 isoform X9 [Spinacia oleracea]
MSNRIYFQVLLLKFLIQIPLAIGYFSSFFSHLFSCYLVCSRIHKFGHQLSRQLQVPTIFHLILLCRWCLVLFSAAQVLLLAVAGCGLCS